MNRKKIAMTEEKLWRITAAAVILSRLLQYAGQGWAVWYTDSYAYSVFYLKDLFHGQAAQGVDVLVGRGVPPVGGCCGAVCKRAQEDCRKSFHSSDKVEFSMEQI